MKLITKTDELAEFCKPLAEAQFVTVDTEFMRERTYWPKLCLAQVAGPHDAAAIDALADGIDLSPLDELMANPLRFLQQRATSLGKESSEWITLALVKMAANDHDAAIKQINTNKSVKLLNAEQRT